MKLYLFVAALLLTLPTLSFAQDGESAATRSPEDMSVDERMAMMKTAAKYDNCIYTQAISRVGAFPDIRQAVDFAMGECLAKLTDLEKSIVAMGFEADYANAFSKRVRNHAARKILPELAVRKSGG